MATEPEKALLFKDQILAAGSSKMVCMDPLHIVSRGFWSNRNPLYFATPLLLLQLSLISISHLLIGFCLKPLGQSSIVSQILGGIIYGPSFLGHERILGSRLFPARGNMILDTIALFGIMFFLFSVGVKSDANMMIRPGKKAMAMGFCAIFITMAFTIPLSLLLKKFVPMDASLSNALVYLAGGQCLTPFPNTAVLLTELKILNTDIGRLAISSAMFCDLLGVTITALGFTTLQSTGAGSLTPLLSIISVLTLFIGILFIFRPAILFALKRIPEGKPLGEPIINAIFVAVLISGFASEAIGQHFVLGALVLGLAVSEGPGLGAGLVSKLDYPIYKVLYPTFLTASGVKTNIFKIHPRSLGIMAIIVVFSGLVKMGAVLLSAHFTGVPMGDSVIIGLILNSRGICELTLYNLWRDAKVLTEQEFALAVISVLVNTAIVTPLIRYLYDPSKQHIPIKRRTIQHTKRDTELRILVCIQYQDNVPSIVSLLEASHPCPESPIAVIAVILVELVGRSAPMLIAHQRHCDLESSNSRSGPIINALRQYELYNEGCAYVQSFSSISHFETMHDDICRVALDQNVTIVIVPFHKQWAIDGSIGSINRAIQNLNKKVMENAPCSVGIFVDRGILTGSMSILNTQSVFHVAVIYIGGPDDVECLSYGTRMVRHQNVTLTLLRILVFGCDNSRERKLDTEFIDEVRQANVGNARFVYQEEVVKDGVGLTTSIRGLKEGYDLIMVGRQHQESALMEGLEEWSECPELGVIGDLMASWDFSSTASVLVVQQQRVRGKLINRTMRPVVNSGGNTTTGWGTSNYGVDRV